MSLPDLPVFYDMTYTTKDGKLTSEASLYNDNLWQTLNELVRQVNNGWQFPRKTPAEIEAYRLDDTVPEGATWYNINTDKLNFKMIVGTNPPVSSIQAVTSTP